MWKGITPSSKWRWRKILRVLHYKEHQWGDPVDTSRHCIRQDWGLNIKCCARGYHNLARCITYHVDHVPTHMLKLADTKMGPCCRMLVHARSVLVDQFDLGQTNVLDKRVSVSVLCPCYTDMVCTLWYRTDGMILQSMNKRENFKTCEVRSEGRCMSDKERGGKN